MHTGSPRPWPKSAPRMLDSSRMNGCSAFPPPLPNAGIGTALSDSTLLKGWSKDSATFSLEIIVSWSLKRSCKLPASLRGWHHPQFYNHRRIVENKTNSRRRLQLPQYLRHKNHLYLKSSSSGLQAAPLRARHPSHPSSGSQISFPEMQ